MIRKILCPSCAANYQPHPEDIADGWQYRRVEIEHCYQPPQSHIKIISGPDVKIIPVATVSCDFCNTDITGARAIATTMWRANEMEPIRWEHGYTNQNL